MLITFLAVCSSNLKPTVMKGISLWRLRIDTSVYSRVLAMEFQDATQKGWGYITFNN